MNKYKSLVFRELKLSARHYTFRGMMFLAFMALIILVMFVLKFQAEKQGSTLDGFALAGAYAVGIMGAVIIGENNDVYKADVNSGWLEYSRTLPLTAFEKTMAKYIAKLIVIVGGSILVILGTVLVYAISGCSLSVNIILSQFVFIDALLIFNIILEMFIMRATDTKALKKIGAVIGVVLAVLVFLPDILPLTEPDSSEQIILDQAMESVVVANNNLLLSLKMPEILCNISIPLMAVILVAGFVITMKNYKRRVA